MCEKKTTCSGCGRCASQPADAGGAAARLLASGPTGKQMTDDWLVEQAGRAAFIASAGFELPAQQAAFLRGFANRVLLSFGADPAAALAMPFTGRVRATDHLEQAKC